MSKEESHHSLPTAQFSASQADVRRRARWVDGLRKNREKRKAIETKRGSSQELDTTRRLNPTTWIESFLENRGLRKPDGRPLYAYRCTGREFASLAETLAHGSVTSAGPFVSIVDHNWTRESAIRAFVIYAAEWWQRHYDGGHWAWEPLLESLGWHRVHYPDLYEPVREALHWWNVDLVRLPTSIRYLGTFACQGGLPLALVGDAHSRVTQYLRAVLRHTAAYRQFVDDAIDLARDQQHLLRPPTLRRDYVFRLAADLTEAVIDLQEDAQGDEPLSALDQARQDWRETMPLDLGNERARELLTGLLREAARDRTAPVDDFRVERFLRRTGIGWRLGARVRLPASIAAANLAIHLGVSAIDLPPRLQVRLLGDRVRVFGMYAAQADDYLLISRDAQSAAELWDAEAAGEIPLQFLAGDVVGEAIVPARGGALGDLVCAFRGDDHEAPFIGEGSVSNRASEIFVLLPDRNTSIDPSSAGTRAPEHPTSDTLVLGRILRTITEPTAIETRAGRCMVRPSAGQAVEADYHLSGQRFYSLEANWPLFRGVPKLRVAKPDPSRAVPGNEVSWRQTGREWQSCPTGFGLWEVRHMHGGELRYLARVGILPERFNLRLAPGSDMTEGSVELRSAESVKVAGEAQDIEFATHVVGDALRVDVRALDAAAVPARVALRLHWQNAAELAVYAPFPGRGGRFLRDGMPIEGTLAIDDLYGVRATALSATISEHFWVEGELKAPDLHSDLLRVAYFRAPLGKSAMTRELSLIDIRSTIDLLLGASSSGDAVVRLRIVDELQREHDVLHVHRFAGTVEYDTTMRFVVTRQTVGCDPPTTYEALPIARPGADPVPLDVARSSAFPNRAVFRPEMNVAEPWLVVARHADRVRVRPVVVRSRSSGSGRTDVAIDTDGLLLHQAVCLHDRNSRLHAISNAMDAMLGAQDTNLIEDEWSFLTNSLLSSDGLPATSFDLLKVLATKPRLLVRSLFRLESTPRELLWNLHDELPFSWLIIRRDIWWTEALQAFQRLREQLDALSDAVQIARDHIASVLSEGANRIRALYTVSCDIGFRMHRRVVPAPIVDDARKRLDDKTQEQLTLRYTMDDWPKGDGRREWTKELERGQSLDELAIWQQEGELRERQPIFDTPVAAAWCCFASQPTDRTTFLVKRIRAHDPEWFDLAYEAAWFRLALIHDSTKK